MNFKVDSNKKQIIYQRHKFIVFILFLTLLPAIKNQIQTHMSLGVMLFIDLPIVISALIVLFSVIKKKLIVPSMYMAGIGASIGFLGGTIDTHLYAVMFFSLLLISIYQEWKVLVVHILISAIGFILYFHQYVTFESQQQYGVFFIMYGLTSIVTIILSLNSEKVRRNFIQKQEELVEKTLEIEEIFKSTKESEKKLNSFNETLNINLNQTKNISKEIVLSFSEISNGINNQTENVSNISANIKEVGEMVDKVVKVSKNMSDSSYETEHITKEYHQEIEKMIKEMEKASHSIQFTYQTVNDLKEKSEKIGEVLNQLNGLTSQTNLLALNASIEAARAGEAGRGFAVVAEEVRKLADSSKKSTEQISYFLNEMKIKTIEVSSQTDEELKNIENTKQSLEHAANVFENVTNNTKNITERTKENEEIIKQLNVSARNIINEMNEIANTSQEISASVEEILSSVENQNQNLDEILTGFKEIK